MGSPLLDETSSDSNRGADTVHAVRRNWFLWLLKRALPIRGGSGRSLQIATGTAWLYRRKAGHEFRRSPGIGPMRL